MHTNLMSMPVGYPMGIYHCMCNLSICLSSMKLCHLELKMDFIGIIVLGLLH